MIFELQSNSYIQQLKNDNVIISGRLVGVDESLSSSTAICSFIINDQVEEKYIIIYNTTGMTWSFLNPADQNAINYVEGDWKYPSYSKRIVAPADMIMDDIGIKFFGWFQLQGLPVVLETTNAHLYCNVILPQHQAIVDSMTGITVETNPSLTPTPTPTPTPTSTPI